MESRLLRRFKGWTPEMLYAQDPQWIEDELTIMNREASAEAERMKSHG